MLRKSVLAILGVVLVFVGFKLFFADRFGSADDVYTKISQEDAYFTGDESCKTCHEKEHKEWGGSHHFMSMLPPTEETVKGNFNNVSFTADGVSSLFFRKENKFYINTEGDDGENRDFEVKYIFGFTPLQQYLIEFPKGKMQVSRLSWDTLKNRWFNQYAGQKIAHTDWLHWTGNSQNWNTMCSYCHSTNLKKGYSHETDSYKTTYSTINVSCESCHGAGKQHIDYINSEDYKDGDRIGGSLTLLPKNVGQLELVNTCAPCHVRATKISDVQIQSNELMDNYIPQIPDTEFYHADGQIKDEDYEYGSFLQSNMYSKGVKCTDCHDAHTMRLKKDGNQMCLQCHVSAKYDVATHTFHKQGTEASLCKNCHTLSKTYMGNDLRRDHSFRVPRPDLSAKYGTPNTCKTCHLDKSDKYLADAIVRWYGKNRKYHFSEDLIPGSKLDANSEYYLMKLVNDTITPKIIKATAAFYLGNIQSPSSLETLKKCLKDKDAQVRYRSLQSLANFPPSAWMEAVAPLLNDKVRAVRIAAADLYVSIPKGQMPDMHKEAFSKAHVELKNYLYYQTDFSVGNIMLADYYLKQEDYDNAQIFYKKGLEKDINMNYALLNLSAVYNIQGKNAEALDALKTALKNDARNERIYYNMALLYNEMGDKQTAEKCFAKAVFLNSQNPRVYYNYALLLDGIEKYKEAIAVLLKGIKLNPNASELYYVLTFVYLHNHNDNKANETAILLKKLDPNNGEYQDLFKLMKSEK